ncbi:hypothetical protein FisN_18Lh259 [Fistulifera solaris]|uniref:Uncharacterized protein n=1 Tax=Fistulifera solaris TaxID=1519565 RepID=A0A1Z5JU93_FISSO|nr:hypothetical protein FisN_18Lh259 [Fistulifera solaris]|eukprot:GAX17603.1 hypothetical protein FisN_18Lh259 [Fistulifera solaris]
MFRRKGRAQSASATMESSRSMTVVRARSKSVPTYPSNRIKGILKVTTVDDSLHNPYKQRDDNKGIQFHNIEIREYARTLSDNPSCTAGPPIGIAWEYNPQSTVISLDKYEEMRPPRRAHFEMVLPRDIRQQMLRYEWDVSQTQIANAVRANIKIKNQRRQTVTNLDKHSKVEELLENAGRSLVRKMLFKKSTRKEMEELDKKMEEVKKIRAQHQMERMEVSDSDLDLESHSGDHTDSESGDGKQLDLEKMETLTSINISSH